MQQFVENTKAGVIQASDAIFSQRFNDPLVHQVVVAYLARSRAGTQAQKTRSEVRGGGIKPFRQKGTGRARAGSIRSPLWKGGGKVFAAKPRDYSQKVNKKMYRAAMCSIFSELVRQDRLRVIDSNVIFFSEPKTRELIRLLKPINWRTVMIITNESNRNFELSARNIPTVTVCTIRTINPVDLVKFDGILVVDSVIRSIEESFI
ncbi:50S ribosomal protein L4 [Candidatus Nitrosoglobus terrae]|nr:50S ribosomal protein L4 [Candidatus Nitrosoglobus terrae]